MTASTMRAIAMDVPDHHPFYGEVAGPDRVAGVLHDENDVELARLHRVGDGGGR